MKKKYLTTIYRRYFFVPAEKTWVAIHDSITYLNEHADETGNRITKGYMTIVTEKLPGIHYTNLGHNGWTSGGIAQEMKTWAHKSGYLFRKYFSGTNDWWEGRLVN